MTLFRDVTPDFPPNGWKIWGHVCRQRPVATPRLGAAFESVAADELELRDEDRGGDQARLPPTALPHHGHLVELGAGRVEDDEGPIALDPHPDDFAVRLLAGDRRCGWRKQSRQDGGTALAFERPRGESLERAAGRWRKGTSTPPPAPRRPSRSGNPRTRRRSPLARRRWPLRRNLRCSSPHPRQTHLRVPRPARSPRSCSRPLIRSRGMRGARGMRGSGFRSTASAARCHERHGEDEGDGQCGGAAPLPDPTGQHGPAGSAGGGPFES